MLNKFWLLTTSRQVTNLERLFFFVTCLCDRFFIRDTRWNMNFFTKFWMLCILTILILCNERMRVDTWAFLPSKNTQHLCKCLHMAWHQMRLMNIVVWWKWSPPNAWNILSKQFTRFLNDGTCDNLNVPVMFASLDYMHYIWKNCPITWQK